MKESIPVSMYVARSLMLENYEESISSLLLLYGYDISPEDIRYFIEGNPVEFTINESKLIIGLDETYKSFLSEMPDRVNINTLAKLHSMINVQVNYTSWIMQDGQVFKDYLETVCSDTDMLEVITKIFLGILRFELFTNYNVLVAWFAVQIIVNNSGYYIRMNREQGRKLLSILKGEIQDIEVKE